MTAEQQDAKGWTAVEDREVEGRDGAISTTCSSIALQAGLQALRRGGNAADAAATVALTQCVVQLGSVVSYAGIMSLLYYDSQSKKVFSMDAGYNSCLREKAPSSIPRSNLGNLDYAQTNGAELSPHSEYGRKVLVPGFMAGVEAMHNKFGRLPFSALFQPAIWYAENGVMIDDLLVSYFEFRKQSLLRTKSGQRFLNQGGTIFPRKGHLFKQLELANLLKKVANHGSSYLYTGHWAAKLVAAVRSEGGTMCIEDLRRYKVVWSEPYSAGYLDNTIYLPGQPNECAQQIIPGLNLAEVLNFHNRPDYWVDATVLTDYQKIFDLTDIMPALEFSVREMLHSEGIADSPEAQKSKHFASAIVPLLDRIAKSCKNEPHHSDSIVVVDQAGNIAALTHSINTVIWGDTGIIVDGIPIPDSACFQQDRLAGIKAGDRLPHAMPQAFVFRDGQPVIACAAIGSSMIQETVKTLLCLAGKNSTLKKVLAAPPLIYNFMDIFKYGTIQQRGVVIPENAYNKSFVNQLRALVSRVTSMQAIEVAELRGTVSTVTIDRESGLVKSAQSKDLLGHCAVC